MATTDLEFLIKAKDQASGVFDKVGKSTGGLENKFKKFNTAANIALGAIAVGLAKFASGSVKAYTDAETSQAQLAAAFKQFPALADTNQVALQNLNTALQDKTKFEDDSIASAQATLATMGLTGKQLEQVTPLLLAYAEKTGTDVNTAAQALGKSFNGQTKALKSVGINYKATGDKAEDFRAITFLLQQKVGGLAEEMGGTAAGQAEILHNKYGDLQEMAGKQLLPILTNLTAVGIGVTTWMTNNQGATVALAGAVVGLALALKIAASWETIVKVATAAGTAVRGVATAAQWAWNSAMGVGNSTLAVFVGVKALEAAAWARATAGAVASKAIMLAGALATGVATAAQWALNVALDANPIGLVVLAIAALIAGLVLFFTKTELGRKVWGGLVAAFKVGWQWIQTAFTTGVAVVRTLMGGLIDVVKRVWQFSPLGIIVTNWGKIISFFKGIPTKVKGIFSGAKTFLMDAGKNIIHGLMNGAGSMAGKIGKFFLDKLPGWIRGPFKAALGIQSPSKVFDGYGRNVGQGLVNGITASTPAVEASAKNLAASASNAYTSAFYKYSGPMSDAAKASMGLMKMPKAPKVAVPKVGGGYGGGGSYSPTSEKEKPLTAIQKVEKRLDALKAKAKDVAASVKSSLVGERNLGSAIQEDANGNRTVTFAGIAANVKAVATRIKTFAKKLKALAKAGIPVAMLQEIAGLGSADGTLVADALLNATGAERKSLAKDYAAIGAYSAQAGGVVGSAVFGAGAQKIQSDLSDATIDKFGKRIAKEIHKTKLSIEVDSKEIAKSVSKGSKFYFALGVS